MKASVKLKKDISIQHWSPT